MRKPLWHGIVLVAGGAIGAGMFALPMLSAGAWVYWSLIGLTVVWAFTILSAYTLNKIHFSLCENKHTNITTSSSFNSIVNAALNKPWAMLNNISFVFIMTILMYAYSTAGAGIIAYSLESLNLSSIPDRQWLSIIFVTSIATLIFVGTSIVSRTTSIFLIIMAVTFTLVVMGVFPYTSAQKLTFNAPTFSYLPNALPAYVTAFACAGLVPTLVRHYPDRPQHVLYSVIGGSLIALFCYAIWLIVTMGAIGRENFASVIENGNNISALIESLVDNGVDPNTQIWVTVLSHIAIITSFLGVSLSLMHFIQDRLLLGQSKLHKLLTLLCCFVPPLSASIIYPYGFTHAISFAGLFVAFSFFILPGLMAQSLRRKGILQTKLIYGYLLIIFGLIILFVKSASLLSWLPLLRQ